MDNITQNNPAKVGTPSSSIRGVSYNAELEDYFRVQYPQYWNEQFYLTDGLYTYTKKVNVTAPYYPIGYKITRASNTSYSLGTTFGRQGSDNQIDEDYSIGVVSNDRAGERISGKVVTLKFLSVFHFSEDFLYKAEHGDTEWDLLSDIMTDRELLQKHTLKRRIYLGKSGKISAIAKAVVGHTSSASTTGAGTVTALGSTGVNILYAIEDSVLHAGIIGGQAILPKLTVGAVTVGTTSAASDALPMIAVTVENDAYFAEGEKYFLRSSGTSGSLTVGESGTLVDLAGVNVRLWQKDYTDPNQPIMIFTVLTDEAYAFATGNRVAPTAWTPITAKSGIALYSCQIERGSSNSIGTVIQPEYEGLQDLLFTQDNIVSGINRAVYRQFNCTVSDLSNKILTAEALRRHMNILKRRNPELVNTSVISASPEALTAVETSMLQLYQYAHDPIQGQTANIGVNEVKFYEHKLLKDDFAEHGKAYIVAEQELGEAVFREWEWITGGAEGKLGFLDRINSTGIYEGFMVRQANTFFEKFNVHSGFKNISETVATDRFSGLDAA